MPESIILEGEKVGLASVREEHAPYLVGWLNELEVIPGASSRQIHTVKSATSGPEAWLTEALNGGESALRFLVVTLNDQRPVGTTELFDIDQRTRTAEFGIVMGERNQGYGTEATQLTVDWAFHVLGMNNVLLRVAAWQARAIAMYEKCGFKKIGNRREAYAFAGHTFDEVLMDVTPPDVGAASRVLTRLPSELTSQPSFRDAGHQSS